MDLCRACLSIDNTLILFDDLCIEKYKILTSLNVSLDDGLPQSICSDCWNCLEAYLIFREQCLNSEISLKDMIMNNEIKRVDSEIKLNDIKIETYDEHNHLDDIETPTDEVKAELDHKEIKDENKTTFSQTIKRISTRKAKKRKLDCGTNIKEIKTENSVVKKLHCGLCKEKLSNKASLVEHLNSHKTDLICLICETNFTSWQELFAHRFNHLDNSQKSCHLCISKYKLEVVMLHHYLHDHSGNEIPMRNTCLWCKREFANESKLRKHIGYTHTVKQFICDYCGKTCNSRHKLKQHIIQHLEKKKFKCHLCDLTYRRDFSLKNHILREHGKSKIFCESCKKYFVNEEKKNKHKCMASVLEVCQVCGKTMIRRAMLEHIKTHENKFRYECKICSVKLKSKYAFKAHTDRHAGTPSHQCKYCPQKFYSGPTLVKHTRIHTGEKPYVCNICDKAFTGNNNLKVHMRVHGFNLVKKVTLEELPVEKDE